MINGNIEQFLDTGWYTEATLYYNDFVYWCEGYTHFGTDISTFFVNRWRATTSDYIYYNEYRKDGEVVDFSTVLKIQGRDMELLKKRFLESPIFDGKTFWEVEPELAWLDDGCHPICI